MQAPQSHLLSQTLDRGPLGSTEKILKERDMSKFAGAGTRHAIQVLIASLLPVLAWAGPVDINKADAATIAKELNGIGLSKAQAIVAWREKNGGFKNVDDLRKIKGIGAKTLEKNRSNIRLDAVAAQATPKSS
jgi:competence protein ComEA